MVKKDIKNYTIEVHGLKSASRFIGAEELSDFADDLSVSSWALEPMKWASAEGLISGIPENGMVYLQPQGKTIRVQAATLIHNFCQYKDLIPLSMETCKLVENPDENGVGELCVKGPTVMLGYYEDKEAIYFAYELHKCDREKDEL